MPRTLSTVAVNAALAQENPDPFLVLLAISHPNMPEPLRVVNNTEEIVSNGKTYVPFPFEVVLGMDDAEQLPEVRLTIDNVERALVETIRLAQDAPKVSLRVVLASQPSVVETIG